MVTGSAILALRLLVVKLIDAWLIGLRSVF